MFQLVIINPQGATLRTGPSTNGGEISKVRHGDIVEIDRLVFQNLQAFDTNYIPACLEAIRKNMVIGDIWAHLSNPQTYKGQITPAYVAFRVGNTQYGTITGAVEPRPPLPLVDEVKIRQNEIDEIFRLLSIRRMEIEQKGSGNVNRSIVG